MCIVCELQLFFDEFLKNEYNCTAMLHVAQ